MKSTNDCVYSIFTCGTLIILFVQLTPSSFKNIHLNNISYLSVKFKKTETWKADNLKICCFPELKVKLIILQQQYLKSSYNTLTPFVATFSKMTSLSSRKYVANIQQICSMQHEQGMNIPKFIKETSIFWVALFRLCLCFGKTTSKSKLLQFLYLFFSHTHPFFRQKNNQKIYIFRVSLSLKESLVATFEKTLALTSRKYVSEFGMIIPNLSEKFFFLFFYQMFLSHYSAFALKKLKI